MGIDCPKMATGRLRNERLISLDGIAGDRLTPVALTLTAAYVVKARILEWRRFSFQS
jgi:hypothetical protein